MQHTNRRKHAGIVLERPSRYARARIVRAIKSRGADILEEAQAQGQNAVASSAAWVRRNPGQALGAAFVLGALTTSLLRRRGR